MRRLDARRANARAMDRSGRMQSSHPYPAAHRARRDDLMRDLRLAKAERPRRAPARRRNGRKAGARVKARSTVPTPRKGSPGGAARTGPGKDLSKLLTPKNIQESMKTVGTLRNFVKSGLNYLQQADRLLDTLFVTSNSLRESGVLEKIIKNRGRNLTTEDFTNILMALMNSPIGGQVLKGNGGSEGENGGQSRPDPNPAAPPPY
jgi:hypothetical protein